jgi:hypothetical protein
MKPFIDIDGCKDWIFNDRALEVIYFQCSACLRLLIFASIFAFQESGVFTTE